jgi:spore germination protein
LGGIRLLHRITWVAAPVIALVVVGTGLGWWGYNQSRERASLTQQVENQYTSSLHNLVSHTVGMEDEIGKSLISKDKSAFQSHLRHIWRLSYAAQTDVGRLPFQLMPLHSTQSYLAAVTKDSAAWIDENSPGTNPDIHHKLEKYYSESKQLTKNLSNVQTDVMDHNAKWEEAIHSTVKSSNNQQKEDNQIVDGLRTVDSQTATYLEPSETLVNGKVKKLNALESEPVVSGSQAKMLVAKFFDVSDTNGWTTQAPNKNADIPVYVVEGNLPTGAFSAHVSQHGGHIVAYDVDHAMTSGNIDFVQAMDDAKAWLTAHGIQGATLFSETQYDKTAYFVFDPVFHGEPVLNQNIAMRVSLDDGAIVDYDARAYYSHPVRSITKQNFSTGSLKNKLTSHFQIRSEENVIAMDDSGHYVPAVLFYGVGGKETYRILMNADTGTEMSIEQLTRNS